MRTLKNGEKRFTISDIKYYTEETSPLFFSRKALKFFSQTMSSFTVHHIDGRVFITAPINGSNRVKTVREFVYNESNPYESELKNVDDETKKEFYL